MIGLPSHPRRHHSELPEECEVLQRPELPSLSNPNMQGCDHIAHSSWNEVTHPVAGHQEVLSVSSHFFHRTQVVRTILKIRRHLEDTVYECTSAAHVLIMVKKVLHSVLARVDTRRLLYAHLSLIHI